MKKGNKGQRDVIHPNAFLSALSDNSVWAEGLQIFYEIFKYLENNVSEELLATEYHRTQAFEEDLDFYLGKEWRQDYQPRESVQRYIEHLETIKAKNPLLLFAYVYHLYMGLLSGGQILQKKRSLASKWGKVDESNVGRMVTTFDQPIAELKTKMRGLVDKLAGDWTTDFQNEFILECKFVFELNNSVVKTIKSCNSVGRKRLAFIIGLVIIIWMLVRANNAE